MITFYNAGAGSGKTHTLSNELASFLIEKKGKPSQVILTTFSTKSAEELKERVRKSLLDKNEPSKAAEMSNALIGTVNGVCSQLVTKYAMEIGISPELRVLDEQSTKTFFNEFVNSTIAEKDANELSRMCKLFGAFEDMEDGGINQKDYLKPRWPQIVKDLANRFRAYNFNESDIERSKNAAIIYAQNFLLTEPGLSVDEIWKQIKKTKGLVFDGQPFDRDMECIDGVDKFRKHIDNRDEIAFTDYGRTGKGLGKSAKKNPWMQDIALLCQEVHRTKEFAEAYTSFIGLLYDTAYELVHGYQVFKQERGLIDFADQENLFLKMLQSNAVVTKEIAATFKLVMVDEFQDSSPVQLAIFTTLKKMIPGAIWVGDPKQAIYGFRDSDTELFKIALDAAEAEKGNKIKPLTKSYRSRPGIVHGINAIFTGIFDGLLKEEHIVLEPAESIKKTESAKVFDQPALQVQIYTDNRAEDYYASVGAYITTVLESEMKVWDKELNRIRKIKGGDIALLFRTNSAVQTAALQLREQGILVSCDTDGLQEQAEVLWITSLLRLLLNPDDPLAVANLALLEGAVHGVEELLAKRLQAIEKKETKEEWVQSSPVAVKITRQQLLLAQMPLVQSISHLITASELPRYCSQWGNTDQRMSNINKVIELAITYEEQCSTMGLAATPSGYLEHLSGSCTHPPSESEEAVTLMSVHKSKGLEWPMVIPVKLGMTDNDCRVLFNTIHVKQPAKLDNDNLLGGQTIVYLPWPFGSLVKVEKVSADLVPNRDLLDTQLQAYKKFYLEEDRLLYVALTRARDYLILPYYKKSSGCCIESENRSNPTGLFHKADWEELIKKAKDAPSTIKLRGHTILLQSFPPYQPLMHEHEADSDTVTWYDMGEEKKHIVHPPRFVSPSKQALSENNVLIEVLDYTQPRLPLHSQGDNLYETVGVAIHNAFASWHPANSKNERTALIENILSPLNGHIKAAELDSQFQSFWDYINKKYKIISVNRELPLTQVSSDNGQIINGIADLVLETKEGLVLIDHKSFPGHFETMTLVPSHDHYAGKYGQQLQFYKEILEKATGKPVIAMLLHYVVQGRIVEVGLGH